MARQHEHTGHHAHHLQQPDGALCRQRVPEDLEEAREHPDAAGTVEMQEVDVGKLAPQHPLREREHEALFHGRPLRAQQAAQREEEQREEDEEPHDRPPVAAHGAGDDAEAAAGRCLRGRDGRRRTGVGDRPQPAPTTRRGPRRPFRRSAGRSTTA